VLNFEDSDEQKHHSPVLTELNTNQSALAMPTSIPLSQTGFITVSEESGIFLLGRMVCIFINLRKSSLVIAIGSYLEEFCSKISVYQFQRSPLIGNRKIFPSS
jgi:hypothetical protein